MCVPRDGCVHATGDLHPPSKGDENAARARPFFWAPIQGLTGDNARCTQRRLSGDPSSALRVDAPTTFCRRPWSSVQC